MQNIKRQFGKAKDFYNLQAFAGLTKIGILTIGQTFPTISQRFAGRYYPETMPEAEQKRIDKAIEKDEEINKRLQSTRVITNEDVDDNFKYGAIKDIREELMPLSPEIIELIRMRPEPPKPKDAPQKQPVDANLIAYNEMKANEKPRTMYAKSLILPYQRSKVYKNMNLEDDRHHSSTESSYPSKQRPQFVRNPSKPAPDKYTYSLKKFDGLPDPNSRSKYV